MTTSDPFAEFRGNKRGRKSLCQICGKSLNGEDEPGGRVVLTLQERGGKAIHSFSRTMCAAHAIETYSALRDEYGRRAPDDN